MTTGEKISALRKKYGYKQEELAELSVTGTAGGGMVEITLSGKREVEGVTVKPEAVDPDDVEMLEDLIMAAINDGYKKADEIYNEKMGPFAKAGGGLF